MDYLRKRGRLSPRIITLLLSSLLLLVISPIIFYGYQHYSIRAELSNIENPSSLLANRYIHSGDWPASKDDSRIITQAGKFKITTSEVKKSKGSELNDQ